MHLKNVPNPVPHREVALGRVCNQAAVLRQKSLEEPAAVLLGPNLLLRVAILVRDLEFWQALEKEVDEFSATTPQI